VCVSRLHRVVEVVDVGAVDVEDIQGDRHRASLLAFDGPPPAPGQWVVVHSGYVLERVDDAEAEGIALELRRFIETPEEESSP
jgi:hydrogenase expression/formation protein HypC